MLGSLKSVKAGVNCMSDHEIDRDPIIFSLNYPRQSANAGQKTKKRYVFIRTLSATKFCRKKVLKFRIFQSSWGQNNSTS